jgi:hypothetical protein
MPFTFTPYTSPLTGSIAQTLQQQGAIEAQRAYATGNAAAQAAVQSGNAWAGAIQGIGQTIGALPGQIQALKGSEQQQAIRDQQLQEGTLKLADARRTEQTAQLVDQYKARVAELANNPAFHNEDGTLNAEGLAGQLSTLPGGAAGPTRPVDREALNKVLSPINADITAARDAKLKWDETKTNALARIAGSAYTLGSKDGNYAPYAQLGLATALKSGLITQDDANAVLVPMVEHPETVPALLQSIAARSTVAPIKLTEGEKLVSPVLPGHVLAENPKPMTPEQVALDAATLGTPTETPTAANSARAVGITQGPAMAGHAETLRHNQEMERIATLTAGREAARDAEVARHNRAVEDDKTAPIDITPDVQTTAAGRPYVDLSGYTGTARTKAHAAANAAGVVPVSKEQANALQEIDNARANQQAINDQIKDLLPTGPGARGAAAVAVPLERLFQSNDQVAAFNSWRTAAIQTLRATAGSKGLRINEAEIAQAIENDIPRLTDTVGTAQQKLKNINTMLENAERSILVRDRSVVTPPPGGAASSSSVAPSLTPGLQRLTERK